MIRFFLIVLAACLIGGPAAASSYAVWFDVPYGDGYSNSVFLSTDHAIDALLVFDTDYMETPLVAVDGAGSKYSTYGPNAAGGWTVYVWSGYHVPDGVTYQATLFAIVDCQVTGQKWDGTSLASATLSAGQSWTWLLESLHATVSQWHTKGNVFQVTPVPEPGSAFVVVTGLAAFAFRVRRRQMFVS